jgi:hypothetical protein
VAVAVSWADFEPVAVWGICVLSGIVAIAVGWISFKPVAKPLKVWFSLSYSALIYISLASSLIVALISSSVY